jgi:hypothetical protein
MDDNNSQKIILKAYGIISFGYETTTKPAISQLSGGSFLLPDSHEIRKEFQNG